MTETEITRASVQTGQTLQKISTGYATAVSVQKPRSLKEVFRRLTAEATIGGETMYYGWGAGKNQIEGPSIHLATAAARAWGNCAVEMEDVQDLGDSWVFTAIFVDIETGFTLKRQFRQSKTAIIYGKHDENRKSEMRFQIGQSKATRNVVLNALPKSMIQDAMKAAKAGVRERLQAWIDKQGEDGLAKAQDAALEQLKILGVKEEQVLSKLGRGGRAAITLDDLIVLKGDLVAVNDGAERIEELYPVAEEEPSDESLMDHLGGEDPFPAPEKEKPSSDTAKPDPQGSKPDAKAEKEEPPSPTAPETSEEEQGPITAEEVDEIASGAFGPVAQESVQELRSRYSRLDEDPEALEKCKINYDAIAEIDGELVVLAVKRVEDYYRGRAAEELEAALQTLAEKEGT